ncbi:MAG: DNA polymerase I [Clostridia bacterium]|nr:DNA polymerase I [Clostridia bacterium]
MKLLCLDGNSIINRAFYGIRPLTTKEGLNTNAIFGFMNILNKLENAVSPDAIVAAFDLKAPTFRHKMFTDYKAGRKPMPPELAEQFPYLKELLSNYGVTVCEKEGFEADDILGTLAKICAKKGDYCYIATGDRDSLQLVSNNTSVLLAATKGGQPILTEYNVDKIKEEYGITPPQLIDVKALMGDTSDNIPGVAGIGQKTALDLIQKHENIKNIYDNLESLPVTENLRNKLSAGKESAFLSLDLGRICCDAPVETDLQVYLDKKRDTTSLTSILVKLEFYKLIERLGLDAQSAVAEEVTSPAPVLDFIFNPDLSTVSENKIFALVEPSPLGTLNLFVNTNDKVALFENIQNEDIQKIFDTAPLYTFDVKNLYRQGFNLLDNSFDVMLAAYLINPSATDYSLSRLMAEYGVVLPEIKDCPEHYLSDASLVGVMPLLCDKLSSKMDADGQTELFNTIEMPLAKVLASMETEGFLVDAAGLKNFGEKLGKDIDLIEKEIYDLVGYEFNLNSPKQLSEALFMKLGLTPVKKTKSGFSTNAEVLEKLKNEHPAVSLLLEYRTLAKLKSTYADGLLNVIGGDGRIHSTLNQTETRTGRISSSEPNLQNIPVRRELGKELRRFFIAKEGCVLVDADYSQIELRVLAHMAEDGNMIDAFLSGEDIHTATAAKVFNMHPELVTPLMRSRAKAVNFGIVYGIGAYSLANDLGIGFGEAKKYIDGYLKTYSGVAKFMDNTVSDAKQSGYVSTLFGRRRNLPEITASNAMVRAGAERIARNMPIQGTAADIIKIAMVNVYKALKDANMKAKLILQVHDELIIEAPIEEREKAEEILKNEMENAVKMSVPLTVDISSGNSWFDTK